LIVTKGVDEGKEFELTEDAHGVGRDSGNRVKLADTEVSRRHAEFRRTPDGYRLLDLGSANGTFVNGQSIRDVLLQPGDQIQIGQDVLLFSVARAEAPPPNDLAEQIDLITRQDLELTSAIVKTVGEGEGSRLLARPDSVTGPWLKTALANLGVMYETIQAVSHILDINQLLDRIMELIFRSLEADRGCIMLRHVGADDAQPGELNVDAFEPKAARWRDGVDRQEKITISRTLMEHVLREKQGVLVSDAARDERFAAVQSIVRFGIREIICVPMKGRHETLGVLYLDSRTPVRMAAAGRPTAGKFAKEHLELAIAIAHQAALAVEETRYHQAMLQAERLAAVGQTIAALSHHIKNILQGLKSGGDILKMGLQDKDETLLLKGWRIVEKNQKKVEDIVMDMLSYSKEREPNFEEVDLNGVVHDVVELMEPRARERGVELKTKLDPSLPKTAADPEGVHRALLNIVGNALDAVEDVGSPRVVVATARESDGEWLTVRVRDNGTGIPPEKLADIFRPFVSTKGARGTGLGLAVSRKIMREHGGDIMVQSEVGKGSAFTLRLPLRNLTGMVHETSTGLPVYPPEE
jgi:signal transduction histidine kinase/pSer/pThr/pTyr-binding forkhead associated (FHA) protein